MGIFRSLSGQVQIQIMGADVYGTMRRLVDADIQILEAEMISELTLRFTVPSSDLKKTEEICTQKGDMFRILRRSGARWSVIALQKRPALIIGACLIAALILYLPSRIWIMEVEGNERIPRNQILESAAACGIRFGASRRQIRSERLKNSLLDALPELQWAGINTYGCRGVITVREKEPEADQSQDGGISSIVASMDGVITDYTVTEGNGMCQPGQAVTAGQVLISGYTDCGLTIKATRAEGEITALTNREISVVTPSEHRVRSNQGAARRFYSVIFGKKRINFYKGSGISGSSCVKMYSKYVLMLPGGFELPLAIVRETMIPTILITEQIPNPEEMLADYAASYLSSQMIGGRMLQKKEQVLETDGAFCLTGQYACLESIGIRREEKIGE